MKAEDRRIEYSLKLGFLDGVFSWFLVGERGYFILLWLILSVLVSATLIQHSLCDEYLCIRRGFDGYRRAYENMTWVVLCFNDTLDNPWGNRSYVNVDVVR